MKAERKKGKYAILSYQTRIEVTERFRLSINLQLVLGLSMYWNFEKKGEKSLLIPRRNFDYPQYLDSRGGFEKAFFEEKNH